MNEILNTIGAPPEHTIEQLNSWLRHKEAGYGPVIAIGIKADKSCTSATFRYEPGQPKKPTIYREGEPIPPGHKKVCEGEAFDAGEEIAVSIYREP